MLPWLQSMARRGSGSSRTPRPLRIFPFVSLLALPLAGCLTAPAPRIDGAPATPPSPSEPWRVPRGAVPPERPEAMSAALPADIAPRGAALMLGDVVDAALRNNPQTQLSWAQARAGAAQYGAAGAARLPTVDATVNAAYSSTTVGQTLGGMGTRRSITPQLSLSYLLFDFGGRNGTITAARDAAIALDLTHNATIQNVALQVEAAYFSFQGQRGLVNALRLNLATADTNLVSAQQRNKAGVATITDVLQAETVRAQAELDLETALGNLQAARGALAVGMGLPANAPFDLAPATDTVAVSLAAISVDTLIDHALVLRPDLAATRVQIRQAQAQVRVARAAELPALTLGSTASLPRSSQPNASGSTYGVTLGLSIPIFNLARPYNVQSAQAQVDAFAARSELLRTQVAQQVYTSYYQLQTATQRARTTDVLLTSATRSEAAARARYRAGVGTILELLTAQSALANARAQQSLSRWTWASALSQLAHDVGVLGPRGETPIALTPGSANAPAAPR
jgi:outer membrane protein